jgi:hypothetical protein
VIEHLPSNMRMSLIPCVIKVVGRNREEKKQEKMKSITIN